MAPLPQQPPATDAANGVTAAEGGDAAAANPPSSSRLATSIHAPRQAAPRSRRATAIAWAGRVGWTGKGVLYALIGGIACRSALAPPTPPGAEQRLGSSSPEVRLNCCAPQQLRACCAAHLPAIEVGQTHTVTHTLNRTVNTHRVPSSCLALAAPTALDWACCS